MYLLSTRLNYYASTNSITLNSNAERYWSIWMVQFGVTGRAQLTNSVIGRFARAQQKICTVHTASIHDLPHLCAWMIRRMYPNAQAHVPKWSVANNNYLLHSYYHSDQVSHQARTKAFESINFQLTQCINNQYTRNVLCKQALAFCVTLWGGAREMRFYERAKTFDRSFIARLTLVPPKV